MNNTFQLTYDGIHVFPETAFGEVTSISDITLRINTESSGSLMLSPISLVSYNWMISEDGMRALPSDGFSEEQLLELMDLLEKRTGLMVLSIRLYISGLRNKKYPQFMNAVEVDILDPTSKEKKTLIYILDEIKDFLKKHSISDMIDFTSDVDIFLEE